MDGITIIFMGISRISNLSEFDMRSISDPMYFYPHGGNVPSVVSEKPNKKGSIHINGWEASALVILHRACKKYFHICQQVTYGIIDAMI